MNIEQHQILVVDDDKEIRTLLADYLTGYQFNVHTAGDGVEMFEVLEKQTVDLIILDLMLPGDDDGLTLCKKVRANSNVPIIMLTAISAETDRIIGLEVGADDYLPKPFNPRELLARMKAVLRRAQEESNTPARSSTQVRFANWQLDLSSRTLIDEEELEVCLSAGEYDLLVAFVDNPQQVLSRDQLLEITKNRPAGPFDRSIDVQISRLRQKMEPDPKTPVVFKTVRGGGYLFTPEVTRL